MSGHASECAASGLNEGRHQRTDPTDASPPPRQCRLVILICHFLAGTRPAAVEASSCAQGSPSKVALVRRSRWAITWIIPWGQTDHEDGPPKAATSESAVGRSSHFRQNFSTVLEPSTPYRRCSGNPAILPPRAGTFPSAPSWGAFSLPAPVLEPIRTSLRSVAPGQGEPLLDQNLSEIPATHVDAGEGTPVAVLAMSLNL
jgi:hypothetical protein